MTACTECKGALAADAKACSECGHPIGLWGACPECKGAITPEQAVCKECGFPLKPVKRPLPAPASPLPPPPTRAGKVTTRTRKRRRGGKGRPILEPGEEPPSAMLFAVFGLVVPILAFIALAQSKRGSGAYILSWVGIGLWIAGALFIATRMHG